MVQGLIKIILISLILIGCNKGNIKKSNIAKELVIEKKERKINSQVSVDSIISDESKAISFLKKKNIIDKLYRFTDAISYKTFKNTDYEINLIKLNYEESLGNLFEQDPVINILYIKKNDRLINYKIFYSINDEDFKFLFEKRKVHFFEYYDSATGWKKNIYYDKVFYQTDTYDEMESIDINTLNLDSNTYKLNNSNKIFKFKVID